MNSGMVSKATFERINRLSWEYGSGCYAHAWVTDRSKDERERGISAQQLYTLTHAHAAHAKTMTYHSRRCVVCAGGNNYTALDYHIRTCKLTNGRTVEFIDTPGHRCYGIHAAEVSRYIAHAIHPTARVSAFSLFADVCSCAGADAG